MAEKKTEKGEKSAVFMKNLLLFVKKRLDGGTCLC